jgi:hypothetical protein
MCSETQERILSQFYCEKRHPALSMVDYFHHGRYMARWPQEVMTKPLRGSAEHIYRHSRIRLCLDLSTLSAE